MSALKMYHLNPIVRQDLKVQLPNCMYKMKSIHEASRNGEVKQPDHVSVCDKKKLDIFDQVKQFLKNNEKSSAMAALEIRQEQILQQLAELKKQMDSIRGNLKLVQSTQVPAIVPKAKTVPKIPDFVINASPLNPPYSLELLQKLWKDYIHLSVKTYTHSSVLKLDETASELSRNLEKFCPQGNVPVVEIQLIWKDIGPNSELIISQRPITGEVNILRYLSRVSSDSLNYETYTNSMEIDNLLDVCYCIVKSKTKTERATLLQNLNKSLGKSNWLGARNDISIADLAAYSAIKQITSNEINVNLGKWYQRCASI